jgi:hypothetical protein
MWLKQFQTLVCLALIYSLTTTSLTLHESFKQGCQITEHYPPLTFRVVNKFEYDIASIIYINWLELTKCPLDMMDLYCMADNMHMTKKLSIHKERRAMPIVANCIKIGIPCILAGYAYY